MRKDKWKWEDWLILGLGSIWLIWVFGRFVNMVV